MYECVVNPGWVIIFMLVFSFFLCHFQLFMQNFKLLCCQSETYSSLVVAWVLMSLETLNNFTNPHMNVL